MTLHDVGSVLKDMTLTIFGNQLNIKLSRDDIYHGRMYIQLVYDTVCTKTGENKSFKGRKWYLSSHMTEDEVVKTVYLAFRTAVEHEVLEGFKINGVAPFNPHVDYKKLLEVSHFEVERT